MSEQSLYLTLTQTQQIDIVLQQSTPGELEKMIPFFSNNNASLDELVAEKIEDVVGDANRDFSADFILQYSI